MPQTLEPAALRRDELPLAGRSMALREFQRAAIDEGAVKAPLATARLVFSAGAAVPRYDWFRERSYMEQLVVEAGAIRMERLTRGAPLLNTHNSWDLEAQLGVVENPSIQAGEGLCDVTFSRRESIAGYVQDVADGIIRNVSVGYVRHRVEMVPPAEENGTWIYRIVDWEPYEVSLVPIPADMDCQVRGSGTSQGAPAAAQRTFPCDFIEVRDLFSLNHERSTVPTVNQEGERAREQVSDEQNRIIELGRRHGIEVFARGLSIAGASFEHARDAVLDELGRRDRSDGGHMNVRSLPAGEQGERQAIINTLAARMGARVTDGSVIRSVDCVGLAQRALSMSGVRVHDDWSRTQIIERAFHTTSDFPNLLGSAVGRVLHEAYMESPAALKAVGRKINASDFRARSIIRVGSAPDLEKVDEHGEFKNGTIGEGTATWKLATFGRIFAVTRQALVNDDLGGFADLAGKFGEAASRREAEELVAILLAPPVIDGGAMFSAGRSSLIPDALDIDGLGAAVLALRKQKDLDGRLLSQEPASIVVPAALEMKALQLVATINATQAGDVQPFRLAVVVEPRLDASSALAWYLVSARQSALEYGYLDGNEGVRVIPREGFEVDGLEVKARLDFGCGWGAPTGWVKSNGNDTPL